MPLEDWMPTVEDVAQFLRARTKDNLGHELGTFTDATRPTNDQVSLIIESVRGEVLNIHGDPDGHEFSDPSVLYVPFRRQTAIMAAIDIEISYYPEQVAAGRSVYDQLTLLLSRTSDGLARAITELGQEGEIGEVDDPRMPQFGFPVMGRGMVGWGSRF